MQTNPSPSTTNSPLVENNVKDLPPSIYNEKDRSYLSFIQTRLEQAKIQRSNPFPEFGGKTYKQIFDENEKIANTLLDGKKNDDDVIVSAGTVESKLDALLANINNLDIGPDVFAFDKNNQRIQELGEALEDIILDTEKMDGEGGDEEKKLLRQRELLKQGTVFVQEEWLKTWETKKKLKKDYNGEFKNFADGWDTEQVLTFDGPSRTLLYGPNVYLGNITEYFMENQPYAFVVIHKDYNVAKAKYGKFENWQYVKPGAVPTDNSQTNTNTIYDNKWRLTDVAANQVEIILYQDQPNDEFQIIINGVMMLPIGFPLSAVSPRGKYNIAKQVFRTINAQFAYGKSFVSSGAVKEIAALIDEMLKLFVLKTRKSYQPPYINTSGKVIPKKVLSAGRISMGIPPDALQAIGNEGNGVTNSEYQVLEKLQELADRSTISQQFAGQQGKAGTTATEVVEMKEQAKRVLGLTIAACSLLEKKLAYLRLYNILANWFEPIGDEVVQIGDVRKEIIPKFRKLETSANLRFFGKGERQITVTDQPIPDDKTIRKEEIRMWREKGYPVQKFYISSEGLKEAELKWYIVINPKEKENSAFYKMLFREEINDLMLLAQFGSKPNLDGLENKFAMVYQESKDRFFQKTITPDMAGIGGGAPGQPASPGSPVDANGGSAKKMVGRPNMAGMPVGQ